MNASTVKYVVDTNTLIQLNKNQRSSSFFLEHAVAPMEVLKEADGLPDSELLQQILRPTTARTLHWLALIMKSIRVGDSRLVNLYANKGSADPLVLACALEAQEAESSYLDPAEWVIVTDDHALRTKAREFEVCYFTNSEFAAKIDAGTH